MNYIGKTSGGIDVEIGAASPNQHVVISGMSGAGKSVRLAEIEKNIIQYGGTVIAFDVNGTHKREENAAFNFISVQEDGLDVKFLSDKLVKEGKETLSNLIQYVMETLCPRELRGACQLGAVRKAIEFALDHAYEFACEMDAISFGLKQQDDTVSMGAYNHLCPILEGEIFRKSSKKILLRKINIISLKGLNPKTQKRVIEIMLSSLWRNIRIGGACENRFSLVIDEFQNLDFAKDTVFFQMLTEARKYGVNMILATQTLTIFSKRELAIINQAAVKLFFQQSGSDAKKIAELIDCQHKQRWTQVLLTLKIGQAVAVGTFEVLGRQIMRPIITYSDYDKTFQSRDKTSLAIHKNI